MKAIQAYIAVIDPPLALVRALIGGDLPPGGASAYFDDFVAIF